MPIKTNLSGFANPLAGQSDRVQLPFAHMRFYWHNGNTQAQKDEKSAIHFGGWFCDSDDFQSDLASFGADKPASIVGPEQWVSRDGKPYSVYSCRVLLAAPIATKDVWIQKDGKTRSTCSMLVYLAFKDAKGDIVPFGPAVIAAKSYNGDRLKKAFKQWTSDTATLRATEAPGVSTSLFYIPVGTFGKQRNQEMVGKGKDQSPIVPTAYGQHPDGWDAALLEKHFVGDEVGQQILELYAMAQEWLNDKPKDAGKPKDEVDDNLPDMNQLPPMDPGF